MGFSEVFGFSIASIAMNDTSKESYNHAGESAKNWFWNYQPIAEEFASFGSQAWKFPPFFHFLEN